MTAFADRLIDATRAKGNPLCAGIDPHLDLIPKLFWRGGSSLSEGDAINTPAVVDMVRDFSFALLDRLRDKVAVIKPQSALFEQLGHEGMALMAELCTAAHGEGILVIMDAKRGDIGSTSAAYARGFLGRQAAFPCDALTVNPFLGMDSLAPFISAAKKTESGLFVLVRTSNQGSADLQGIRSDDGRPIYHHLAEQLRPLVDDAVAECGFSSIGIVAGATYPEEAKELRTLLPKALFLVPGFGAQGGGRDDALAGFVDGPEGLEGGVVNASRGLSFPAEAADSRSASQWGQAIDQAIDNAITTLSTR